MIKSLAIFLILTIVIPGHVFSQTNKKEEYSLQIRKGTVVKGSSQNIWTIPTTLTNLSDDTLKYFSVRCSWQDFYFVNNEKLFVLKSMCEKNNPIVLKLPPKKSTTVALKLLITPTLDTSFIRFKVGFDLIRANKPTSEFNIKDVLLRENVIWSNEIKIQN
jgi:hypothetical protein